MGDFNQNVELNENTTLTQKYDKLTQQLDDSTYEDLITFQPRAYKNGL